ncbi:hypothetical protein Tco_0786187 [Tanacetum coccineum]
MSLDDLYNHLKVYESEVQKKTGSSSQNLAFISSSNTSSGKSEVSTAQATQQSGFQIKYEDIIQIDDDDIEEMDIKWKKTGKKRESYKKEPKVEEPSHKAMMAIDGIGWDWSFMAEENEASENQALVEESGCTNRFYFDGMIRVIERDLELKDYKIENLTNDLEEVKKERDGIDSKLEKFVNSSKDLDLMLESLHEFADNTITDYTRPTPSVDVTNDVRSELDGNNLTVCEHGGTSSNAVFKAQINFVKEVHQVTPKECHLHAVKRIFRYLKGHPKLGLWYPKESPFDLVAYSDSDYGGASQDRKSTTGGCQFLGRRLISWQCKKQTIVATSTTEAEYVAAASGCGQVLWIQNQLLDYGYNFMNTKIYIDNNSAICIVKNPVFHSRTKHIEIRHHFIRDCFEKKLIYVDHIHTDDNVADLLTKAFDVGRF